MINSIFLEEFGIRLVDDQIKKTKQNKTGKKNQNKTQNHTTPPNQRTPTKQLLGVFHLQCSLTENISGQIFLINT